MQKTVKRKFDTIRLLTKGFFLCFWLIKVSYLSYVRRRSLLVVRSDAIGHLALCLPQILHQIDSGAGHKYSQQFSKPLTVLPDSGICNYALWRWFAMQHTPSVSFLNHSPIFNLFKHTSSMHHGLCQESREAFYALTDHSQWFRHRVVDGERWYLQDLVWIPPVEVRSKTNTSTDYSDKVRVLFPEIGAKSLVLVIDRDSLYRGDAWDSANDTQPCELNALIVALLAAGYFVVRMGSARRYKVDISSPDLVDLPFHPAKSAEVDIGLVQAADFAIGWDTGLNAIPSLFGVRTCILTTCMVQPVPGYTYAFLPWERKKTKKPVPFMEVFIRYRSFNPGLIYTSDRGNEDYFRRPLTQAECNELVDELLIAPRSSEDLLTSTKLQSLLKGQKECSRLVAEQYHRAGKLYHNLWYAEDGTLLISIVKIF